MPKQGLNVLFFIPHLSKKHGGVFQYSLALLSGLRNTQHRYFVLCFKIEQEFIDLAKDSNIEIIPFSKRMGSIFLFIYSLQGLVNRIFNYLINRRVIIGDRLFFGRWIKKYKIDIIHSPNQRLLKLTPCKAITTIHDLQQLHHPSFFSKWEINYRKINFPAMANKADAVLVSYNHVKHDLEKYFNIPSEKIMVGLLDMKNLWFDGLKKEDQISDKQYILYPAATWPHKNHMSLLAALHLVKEKFGKEINLVCTGNKTGFYFEIESKVVELGLEEQVEFKGVTNNRTLFNLYQNARAVVVPTIYEAGSFPLMESILMGVPVICSNVTSLPETIGDNQFVFDPFDIIDMADKIYKIVYDQDYRKHNLELLSKQAELLKNTKMSDKVDELYRKLI
jgi:glycosyltransferase involved in cell wall biosynthesis